MSFAPPTTSDYHVLLAAHRLAHLKPLELRVIQIQRLVVPCSMMCCPERL